MLRELLKKQIPTVPETEKPFVHLIRIPESMEVCFTGNENVNPVSLLLFFGNTNFPPSFFTNFASAKAIKSKSSYKFILPV